MGISAALCSTTVGIATQLPLSDAQSYIGYLGCGVCVAMFGGPLASMTTALQTRSAAAFPPGFAVFSTINTSVWLGYGALVLGDPFIWAPNVLGLASSITQLGLIARFGTAPPKAQEANVEESSGSTDEATAAAAGEGADAKAEDTKAEK